METTINHNTRHNLDLSLVEYAVADYIHRASIDGLCEQDPSDMAEILGLPQQNVTKALNTLKEKTLIYKMGETYPSFAVSANWVEAVMKQDFSNIEDEFHKELAFEAIDYFNQELGKSAKPQTYEGLFKKIVRDWRKREKNIDNDRIRRGVKAVVDHKIKEWINSDMAVYLRPKTLFGGKFGYYLDEARSYFKSIRS